MGAKKWSTILNDNYLETGRLWPQYPQETETEYYTKAGFSDPSELIQWSNSRHYTMRLFYGIYLHSEPFTKTLRSVVTDLFKARFLNKELFKFLSDDIIMMLSDKYNVQKMILQGLEINADGEPLINDSDKIKLLGWLSLNIDSMKRNSLQNDEIRDLLCLIKYNEQFSIVNSRVNLQIRRMRIGNSLSLDDKNFR